MIALILGHSQGGGLDLGIDVLILAGGLSVPEAVAYKALVNVGSHAMVDAITAGAKALTHFRGPPSSNLIA